MPDVKPIRAMSGYYFKGVSLTVPSCSAWDAECKLAFLEQQREVSRVMGYYFPHLQTALYVLLVETPFQCDALSRIRGLTGPGTPFFANQ